MSKNSFTLVDETGMCLLEAKEIASLPPTLHEIDLSHDSSRRVVHLASDIAKGAISVPNKTLELVFKPEIQAALDTKQLQMMVPKDGNGFFADVIGANKKIVAKGRLVESGKVRQLATGAFQLVSVAVAQSHLADINESLTALNGKVDRILKHLENYDKSKITGALNYLNNIALDIASYKSSEELSEQKKVVIETIIKDSHSWVDKVFDDFNALIDLVEKQADKDRFGGTENTYDQLKSYVSDLEFIREKRYLLCELHKLLVFVLMYVDPLNQSFSTPNIKNESWLSLTEKFDGVFSNKTNELLTKAFWNAKSTLATRKENLQYRSNDLLGQLKKQNEEHLSQIKAMESNVRSLLPNNEVKVALTFDELGNVNKAVFV